MLRKMNITIATDKSVEVTPVSGKDGLKSFFESIQQTNEARKKTQFGLFSQPKDKLEKLYVLYENDTQKSLFIINPTENHIEHYDILYGRGMTDDMKQVIATAMPNAQVKDVSLDQRKQNIYDFTANQVLPKRETNETEQMFLNRAIVNGIQQIEQALELEKQGALSMISVR